LCCISSCSLIKVYRQLMNGLIEYLKIQWSAWFALNIDSLDELLGDISVSPINTRIKLHSLRSLYYLSFRPENREIIAKQAYRLLDEVRVLSAR
jgi:hypothetical protein